MKEQPQSTVSAAEAGLPLSSCHIESSPARWLDLQLGIKRGADVLLASVLILLFLPLLIALALCICISSRGPVLFRQKRWGWKEGKFYCLKFRTMFEHECSAVPLDEQDEMSRGILFKPKQDSRVTKAGAFLRKTSLDELPQLFNVLAGDMSLVGPRPLVLHMLEPFPQFRKIRSVVRPGMTGLWHINARHLNTSALDMKPYDLEYIANFSLLLDVKILLFTPSAMFSTKGAH